MLRLNKYQLDLIATIIGLVGGCAGVLGANQMVDARLAGSISGISTVFLGAIVQRPALAPPTTEQVEEKES
jgi:hypothetical protein